MIELPFPEVRQVRRWRLTAATATSRYDCTLRGITERCGGRCCHGPTFWPGRTGPDNRCVHLGDQGCTLGDARPVTCHLYPLRLNANGTLVIHGGTRFPAVCRGNRGHPDGPMLIDALRGGLAAVVGWDEYWHGRSMVLRGVDALFRPLPWVPDAMAREDEWEAANVPPEPRRDA